MVITCIKSLSAMKPRVKDHYHAHRLSYWLNLIPRLHTSGDANVSVEHHKLQDHDNSHTYDGVVRNNPALIGYGIPGFPGPSNRSEDSPSLEKQNDTKTDSNISLKVESKETELISRLDKGNSTQNASGQRVYSTALFITIAVGCALLVLNILIFAGIYYQKEKDNLEKKLQKTFYQVRNIDLHPIRIYYIKTI